MDIITPVVTTAIGLGGNLLASLFGGNSSGKMTNTQRDQLALQNKFIGEENERNKIMQAELLQIEKDKAAFDKEQSINLIDTLTSQFKKETTVKTAPPAIIYGTQQISPTGSNSLNIGIILIIVTVVYFLLKRGKIL